jgi:hypothetical protein
MICSFSIRGATFQRKEMERETQIWELAAYHKHLLDSIKHGLMMSKYQELAVCLCHIYTQFAITSDAAAQTVATRVGQVLETEPKPPWYQPGHQSWYPQLSKNQNTQLLLYNHGSQNFQKSK